MLVRNGDVGREGYKEVSGAFGHAGDQPNGCWLSVFLVNIEGFNLQVILYSDRAGHIEGRLSAATSQRSCTAWPTLKEGKCRQCP